MTSGLEHVSLGSFAFRVGDEERKAEDIPRFGDIWATESPGADFSTMGCGLFRRMSAPVEVYVVDCVQETLRLQGTAPDDVDHVVFATTDAALGLIPRDLAVTTLTKLGMVNCVPAMLSLQQCCSSLTAIDYASRLFTDPDVKNVVVVSFDFTRDDRNRIRPFALFGDAVASCLITRALDQPFRLVASTVNVDYDGLVGDDSFVSRQRVAQASLRKVMGGTSEGLAGVRMVFPTNLYKPVTQFNASAVGLHKSRLHFSETLSSFGHCGNCDWMLNLIDYQERVGLRPGDAYLAQASAPGFFGCALLQVTDSYGAPPTLALAIEVDDLSGSEIAQFLADHVAEMRAVTPLESKHALDLEGLRRPEITFWSVMDSGILVGCGAIKALDPEHAEIKAMRTAPTYKRRGVASVLLTHIIAEAQRMGFKRLSLETGSFDFFEPARQLYLKHGFVYCEPFGDYKKDPNSVHMTRWI